MQSKPIIFVRRVTNLSDARYCAGMGASLLGFVADPQDPGYVDATQVKEIMGWVSGPSKVIEVTSGQIDLKVVAFEYNPDFLHITLKESILSELMTLTIPLILNLTPDSLPYLDKLVRAGKNIKYLTLSNKVDQSLIKELNHYGIPILMAITDEDELVGDLQSRTDIGGFVLQGSNEIKPGLKDYDHLSGILEALDL